MVGVDVYIAFMCLRVCFLYLIELPFDVICCVIVCLLAGLVFWFVGFGAECSSFGCLLAVLTFWYCVCFML